MKKNNWLLIGVIAAMLVAAVLIVNSASTDRPTNVVTRQTATPQHNHTPTKSAVRRVPAFEVAPTRANLRPTLEPEQFTGITRDAYRAVRQIPTTIAQLPCYCHCDESFGHKSLYTCFEDDHAAHCVVCVNEALLALTLEKQKLTPAQIRERIVAQYSNQ